MKSQKIIDSILKEANIYKGYGDLSATVEIVIKRGLPELTKILKDIQEELKGFYLSKDHNLKHQITALETTVLEITKQLEKSYERAKEYSSKDQNLK